jgi:nicotinamidase/pyrazinamidase
VHCVRETPGSQLHPDLDQHQIDAVIDKGQRPDTDGYSAFEAPELRALLLEHGITAVTVAGLATDYCVLNTARDAFREGFRVTVDTSATRAVDAIPGDGERALAKLLGLGADVADLSAREADS